MKLHITFYGGVGAVTGANFLVETESGSFLVDCGLLQGVRGANEINREPFAYDVTKPNILLVTHAHIDHIGRIPKLMKEGFTGTIYSTPETKELAALMLADAAHIMEYEYKEHGTPMLYTSDDVAKAFDHWKIISYHTPHELFTGVSVEIFDAGHILGSGMFLVKITEGEDARTILFTGDLGNSPSLLLPDTEYITGADYVVMDSVYGDRNHESKEDREKTFKQTLLDAIERKGTIVIPAFSLERTQTILYEINNLVENKEIPSIPVFLDSPLGIKLTHIYEKITALYNSDVQKDIRGGDKIFAFPKFKQTARSEESRNIHLAPDPKIIIAGSGMSTAGRVLAHEMEYLPQKNATIVLMGYQATGTLGRELQEGSKEVIIRDTKVPVNARIVTIDGYSAHKDSDHLVDFIAHITEKKPRKVFVVMGEPKSSLFLAQRLRDYVDVEAIAPERGKRYELQ